MAFQAGTPVDPRLMQADYSGFANAASIRANALANLGQQIGQGIEKYKKKKQDAADDEAFAQAVEPYLMDIAGGDADEAKAMGKFLRKDPAAFNAIQSLRKSKEEEEKNKVTQSILDQFSQGIISAQEAFSMGVDPASIEAVSGITEGQDAKKFAESVALAAESVGGTYDPTQKGIVVDDTPYIPGGKRLIPLSDPMFENYFATAKARTMTGRGFDVLATNSSAPVTQGQGAPSALVSAPASGSSPNLMSGIGSAISSIAQTPGNLDPTNPTISTDVPIEYTEPALDISEVAGGAVSRMSDFFKRKLKENESVRQSTYGY